MQLGRVGAGLVYAAREGWGRDWCMQLGKGVGGTSVCS